MRRSLVLFVLAFAALSLGVLLVWRGTPSSVADAPTLVSGGEAKAPEPRQLTGVVTQVSGEVEKWSNGNWMRVKRGELLTASDRVRTGPGGQAELELGPTVRVNVADLTELTIGQISESLSRVRLEDGRLASVVDGSEGFRFRVDVRGSDAVVETEDGEFGVLKRGDTPVTVASRTGNVRLVARGKLVELKAGEQSLVYPGEAPTPPTRLPSSLLLKLGKPPSGKLRNPELVVSGTVTPGTYVTVAGRPARVAPDGSVEQSVRLEEGVNVVEVKVEDVLGRQRTEHLPRVVVDSTAPPVSGKVTW
jgi:hypothetical protein